MLVGVPDVDQDILEARHVQDLEHPAVSEREFSFVSAVKSTYGPDPDPVGAGRDPGLAGHLLRPVLIFQAKALKLSVDGNETQRRVVIGIESINDNIHYDFGR